MRNSVSAQGPRTRRHGDAGGLCRTAWHFHELYQSNREQPAPRPDLCAAFAGGEVLDRYRVDLWRRQRPVTGHRGFMTPAGGSKWPVQYALLEGDAVPGKFVGPTARRRCDLKTPRSVGGGLLCRQVCRHEEQLGRDSRRRSSHLLRKNPTAAPRSRAWRGMCSARSGRGSRRRPCGGHNCGPASGWTR